MLGPNGKPLSNRRKALARMTKAQLKQRKQRQKRRRIIALLSLVLIALAVYILVFALRDDYKLENENDPVATITMANGDKIIIELFPSAAPETVNRFIALANEGYYDGLPFHRVIANERVQTGAGSEKTPIHGEFALNGVNNPLSHTRGTLSMARLTGYDTASSEFFICLGDQSYFDGAYAAFGRVVKGMEYVDKIASVRTDSSHKPLADQTIKTIRVEQGG